MDNILICGYRDWSFKLFLDVKETITDYFCVYVDDKELLDEMIDKYNPKYIFFPDWSWIVSDNIIKNFNCVCIHESNLPKFRGGSPIQNQIIRGIIKTKSTAFFMNSELDAGKILLQKDLSLEGTLDEIFLRMEKNNYNLITKIISGKFKPSSQKGKPTFYKSKK